MQFWSFWAKYWHSCWSVVLAHSYRRTNETLFRVENISQCVRDEKMQFSPEKVNFLFWNSNFCQQGVSSVYTGLQFKKNDPQWQRTWSQPELRRKSCNTFGQKRHFFMAKNLFFQKIALKLRQQFFSLIKIMVQILSALKLTKKLEKIGN